MAHEKRMLKQHLSLKGFLLTLMLWPFLLHTLVPIELKNLVEVEGVRSNLLVGYGLVVGLSGTGDSLRASPFTRESMVGMLSRLGVGLKGAPAKELSTRNAAAVMVTATLPPFARQGKALNISVAAIGDARSLKGGVLLVTPLLGADAQVYAVAQGMLATSSFNAQGTTNQQQGVSTTTSITQGVPTRANIPEGAIVEREVPFQFKDLSLIKLSLKRNDFTTAKRVADVINDNFPHMAEVVDPGTVQLTVPQHLKPHTFNLISDIEKLRVVPDSEARVVLNEAEGVVVMGANVRIDTVAISHGNLTVRIDENFQVAEPSSSAASGGNMNINQEGDNNQVTLPANNVPVVTTATNINVNQQTKNMGILEGRGNLRDLVDGLNAFNLPASELGAVLRSIHKAGAMHAKLDIC